ncbi:MAG: hypothetical protein A2751_03760 [Candidatus Doudnabacteria bacterium RIFCSPHIGHO2_01_FULL_46_14]|uniref:Uncharacterized protein n=1 Tax=Candidatus Doudnabacteria bacterium RIFCSPHIGHO2_01_FULL_46_14 TaxID=1817824 RepID=A0A1F5NL17_9BACT|nr:MAG: hypothetical protein A2751_03760 [Candidatus Doudnabacteria bacterium RIFCSPHIGHO2_01_FULL_46_14]
MKIVGPNGVQYTIKEVYSDDDTPNEPDVEIPNGTVNSAIVIQTDHWDWTSFRENKKREGVIALKLG